MRSLLIQWAGKVVVAVATSVLLLTTPAHTQNMFKTVARVNDGAITAYEQSQRELLLKALNATGDLSKQAVDKLIEERLQQQATARAGITLTQDQIDAGIEEFAGRADITVDQFTTLLAKEGVAPETFRDFITAQLAWREFVRSEFRALATVSDTEVDSAVKRASLAPGGRESAQVLISELFLPANTPEATAESDALAAQIVKIKSFNGFSEAARENSIGPSRVRGGRVETWVPLTNLPPAIARGFLTMRPGEVTEPFPLENAMVLFQLRALQEVSRPAPKQVSVDYAAYYIAGGRSPEALQTAADLRARVDQCDDLFGIAKGQPEEVLERSTLPVSDIPTDVAVELAKLDSGEVSTALTRANGQTLVFLMLCNRNTTDEATPDREAVRQRLINQRLSSYAETYLAELRADAIITFP